MPRILVIADDLTGAAEIAGIGVRFGLATRLLRKPQQATDAELTVVDTNSRLLPPAEAIDAIQRAATVLAGTHYDVIFKKTDSVLRGPLLAEVAAMRDAFHLRSALLVPQNPSRGRTILAGQYMIDNVPLHQTSFASDPHHPADTADVLQLLRRSADHPVTVLNLGSTSTINGICLGCAATVLELQDWCAFRTPDVLPAGGADFFAALLGSLGLQRTAAPIARIHGTRRLFICGTASASRHRIAAQARENALAVLPLPDDVFSGADVATFASVVADALGTIGRVMVMIPQAPDPQSSTSRRIETILAKIVAHSLAVSPIDHIYLEGGATASAICQQMTWNDLDVVGELGTGVVQMRATGGQLLTVKPGSYDWPGIVWK
jgi:uncharacterized protein YgbK (DUF1537 family)